MRHAARPHRRHHASSRAAAAAAVRSARRRHDILTYIAGNRGCAAARRAAVRAELQGSACQAPRGSSARRGMRHRLRRRCRQARRAAATRSLTRPGQSAIHDQVAAEGLQREQRSSAARSTAAQAVHVEAEAAEVEQAWEAAALSWCAMTGGGVQKEALSALSDSPRAARSVH